MDFVFISRYIVNYIITIIIIAATVVADACYRCAPIGQPVTSAQIIIKKTHTHIDWYGTLMWWLYLQFSPQTLSLARVPCEIGRRVNCVDSSCSYFTSTSTYVRHNYFQPHCITIDVRLENNCKNSKQWKKRPMHKPFQIHRKLYIVGLCVCVCYAALWIKYIYAVWWCDRDWLSAVIIYVTKIVGILPHKRRINTHHVCDHQYARAPRIQSKETPKENFGFFEMWSTKILHHSHFNIYLNVNWRQWEKKMYIKQPHWSLYGLPPPICKKPLN